MMLWAFYGQPITSTSFVASVRILYSKPNKSVVQQVQSLSQNVAYTGIGFTEQGNI